VVQKRPVPFASTARASTLGQSRIALFANIQISFGVFPLLSTMYAKGIVLVSICDVRSYRQSRTLPAVISVEAVPETWSLMRLRAVGILLVNRTARSPQQLRIAGQISVIDQ